MHIPRFVSQFLISLLILGLLAIGAGTLWALYGDRTPLQNVAVPAETTTGEPKLKPTPPSDNVPESVAVEGITSPVRAGDEASVNVQTLASSTCTIVIGYTGAPGASDVSFSTRAADAYGVASWAWAMTAAAPVGNWPVKVICTYHGRSAMVMANLQIAR